MSKALRVVKLPSGNCRDVAKQLRALAKEIESGELKGTTNVAWVADFKGVVEIGMCGQSASPGAEAHLLFGCAMRKIEAVSQ